MQMENGVIEKVDKPDYLYFAKALKYLTDSERGLVSQLAVDLKVSQAQITRIRRGVSKGSVDLRFRIARYFDRTEFEFIELGKKLDTVNKGMAEPRGVDDVVLKYPVLSKQMKSVIRMARTLEKHNTNGFQRVLGMLEGLTQTVEEKEKEKEKPG